MCSGTSQTKEAWQVPDWRKTSNPHNVIYAMTETCTKSAWEPGGGMHQVLWTQRKDFINCVDDFRENDKDKELLWRAVTYD